jgi:hypothetical protein
MPYEEYLALLARQKAEKKAKKENTRRYRIKKQQTVQRSGTATTPLAKTIPR